MLHANDMVQRLAAIRKKAYAPYSNFHVAAIIVSNSGQFYEGCNVENASYSLTLCAEASAIAQMIVAGEREIESVWLQSSGKQVCAPCGACRQQIFEFANQSTTVYLCDEFSMVRQVSIGEILPLSFDKSLLP